MAPTARNPDSSQISHQMEVAASRAPSRPSARRLQSGGWSRLRPPQVDPLSVYGLPSKGEARLNEPKAQESYYRKIVDRYMTFCAAAASADKLEAAFRSMSITPALNLRSTSPTPTPTATPMLSPSASTHTLHPSAHHISSPSLGPSSWDNPPVPASSKGPANKTTPLAPAAVTEAQKTELALLLSAMRKLRESLTATRRSDRFAQSAYLFILRSTILTRTWESYVPCIDALIGRIHPATPLASSELRDVVSWWVLDLVCRQGDIDRALTVRDKWCGGARAESPADRKQGRLVGGVSGGGGIGARTLGRDRNVDAVIRAVIRDDWLLWRSTRSKVDGYGRALMGFAEEKIRLHTLKVVGRAYRRMERLTLESWTGKRWDELLVEGVGWELEERIVDGEQWVTISRNKSKPA